MAITGGIVSLTVATGGAALGLFIASSVVGVGAAGSSWYINSDSNEKHEKHTTKLRDALMEEVKTYEKFQHELSVLTNEGFQFELQLKNKIRKYQGKGKEKFDRLTNSIIPSLKNARIQDTSAKIIFEKLLSSVDKMLQDENTSATHKLEIISSLAQPFIAKLAKEGAEEAAKGATVAGAKAVGSCVGIGLGGIFLVIDGQQMYKDWNIKSIGESFLKMADDISRLPPAEIDF